MKLQKIKNLWDYQIKIFQNIFFAKFISRDILKNEIYFLGEILKWLVHFGRWFQRLLPFVWHC